MASGGQARKGKDRLYQGDAGRGFSHLVTYCPLPMETVAQFCALAALGHE